MDFGATDGPADLVFLIAAPEPAAAEHMKLLTSLARALVRPDFVAVAARGATAEDVVALVDGVVNPGPAAEARAAPADQGRRGEAEVVVAITACPTGIAHTYMAADALEAAAERAGVNCCRDPGLLGQHAAGRRHDRGADAVIFATDVGVRDRGGSPASRSSPPASSGRSTNPTR